VQHGAVAAKNEQQISLARQRRRVVAGNDLAPGALDEPRGLAQDAGAIGYLKYRLKSVRDSKALPAVKRELLFDLIKQDAIAVSVGIIAPQTIDVIGILNATKIAMCHAVEQLASPPDYLLIDFLRLPQLRISQKPITRGDKLCLSIACASIIAKVTRDRIMVELDQLHPGYGLADHKGYGTRRHVSCLRQNGPSPIHRYSFAPVKEATQPK
jgi:ribonuclease HII